MALDSVENPSTSIIRTGVFEFWNDDVVDLNPQRLKKDIPQLPKVDDDFQVVKGKGPEVLAYLILQIMKSEDRRVVIRAMASACSYLMNDSTNYTGAKTRAVELIGLSPAADENTTPDTALVTNFEDAEPVTVGELLNVLQIDDDEVGAYFGVLFLAGNKRANSKNKTAFNEKRKDAATASILGSPRIFVPDSEYLTEPILIKLYASFLSYSPVRANMTSRVIQHLDKAHMGSALSFVNMFLLLVDSGMSALRMIKEAAIKQKWMLTEFADLKPEFQAANNAQIVIRNAPPAERSFLKAIHGNAFVPVNYNDINNLLGVSKEILKRTVPTYANYDGGRITSTQIEVIERRLGTNLARIETVNAE